MNTHTTSLPDRIYMFLAVLVSIAAGFCASGCSSNADHYKPHVARLEIAENAVDINSADTKELLRLPNIGPALAKKIVEHRMRHGTFRRPELLLLVDGISDKRFRAVRKYIKTD